MFVSVKLITIYTHFVYVKVNTHIFILVTNLMKFLKMEKKNELKCPKRAKRFFCYRLNSVIKLYYIIF